MSKYFYNFFLIIKNINNYGLFTFFYASIVEIFYLLKFYDFKSYLHDNSHTSTYEETKKSLTYNTQHTPTPYFFLSIALKFLKKENYDNFILIDMGCGYGRVGKYFNSKLNILFYGLEINKTLIDSIQINKSQKKNFNLIHIDLRDRDKREKIFYEIKKLNKKIVIFFSDPFDIDTIIDVLAFFSNNQHLIIGVNVNNLDKLTDKYKIEYIKYFKNKLRHVVLLKKNV